jgi:hypothetical protein
MKKATSFFLIILTLLVSSCKQNKASDLSKFKDKKMIQIPGSKVSFPQSSFSLSDKIVGLTKDNNALILITEMPNEAFQKSVKGQSRYIESRNPNTLLERKDMKIGNYQGILWIFKEPNNTKIRTLLFGDSSFTIVITARHDLEDHVSDKEIEFLLANIIYDDRVTLNPLERAPYYIDGDYNDFKNYRNSQNTHFYSKEGEDLNPQKSLVIIHGLMKNSNDFENTYTQIWSKKIKENGIKPYNINKDKLRVNGYEAYESIFEINDNGETKMEYFLFIHNGKKYIGVSAIATTNLEMEILDFKKFSHQIKFKK